MNINSALKHFIEAQYKKRGNSEDSKDLAATIESNVTSLFSSSDIAFELLQNAEDTGDNAYAEISLQFTLTTEQQASYLIVSHNGGGFSAADIEALCSNMRSDLSVKAHVSGKIGYKGHGFKSVFTVSDRVQVVSQGFSFRFDKSYFTKASDVPWRLMPIWTTNEETPVRHLLNDDNRTYFILRLRDQDALRKITEQLDGNNQQLNRKINNPKNLLCLQYIKKIEIFAQGQKTTIEKKVDNNIISLSANDTLSHWLFEKYIVDIPSDVKPELMEMSEHVCPDRLKTSSNTTIMLAAKLDRVTTFANNNEPIFCVFPTQEFRFPVLVSADFFLNSKRTHLIDSGEGNAWNKFLIKNIPMLILKWLKRLSCDIQYANAALQLMPPLNIVHTVYNYVISYREGLTLGLSEIDFIPSFLDRSQHLRLHMVRADPYNFLRQFSDEVIKSAEANVMPDNFKPELYSHPDLSQGGLTKLHEFMVYFGNKEKLNLDTLIPLVEKMLTHGVFSAIRYRTLLKFLFQHFIYEPALKNAKIITIANATTYEAAANPKVFLPPDNVEPPPFLIPVFLIDSRIWQDADDIKLSLQRMGKVALTLEQVLAEICHKVSNNGKEILVPRSISHVNELLAVINYLYKYRQYLSKNHLENLSYLALQSAAEEYAAAFQLFMPTMSSGLKIALPLNRIVNVNYYRQAGIEEAFLERLGAKGELSFRYFSRIPIILIPQLFLTRFEFLKQQVVAGNLGEKYLEFIRRKLNENERRIYLYIENFSTIDMLEILAAFAQYHLYRHDNGASYIVFLQKILNVIVDNFQLLSKASYFIEEDGSNKVPCNANLISLIFSEIPIFPAQFNNQHLLEMTGRVYYVPSLSKVIRHFYTIPNINFPEKFGVQHARFLGFVTELKIEDYLYFLSCQNILQSLLAEERMDFYKEISKNILSVLAKDPVAVKNTIGNYLRSHELYFVAEDNSLKSAKHLYFCEDHGAYLNKTRLSELFLKHFDFWSKDDFVKMARAFEITPVNLNDLEVKISAEQDSTSIKDYIIGRLNHVARAEQQDKNGSTEQIAKKYETILKTLIFSVGATLELVHKKTKSPIQEVLAFYDANKNTFYLTNIINILTIDSICYCLGKIFSIEPSSHTEKILKVSIATQDDNQLLLYLSQMGYVSPSAIAMSSSPYALSVPSYPSAAQSPMPMPQTHAAQAAVSQQASPSSQEIGGKGEEYFFRYLYERYMNNPIKFRALSYTPTDNGYIIRGCKYKKEKSQEFTREIQWHNSKRVSQNAMATPIQASHTYKESGSSKDFTVKKWDEGKNDGKERERIVEIKTTMSPGATEFRLSANEVKEKIAAKENYRLVRIYSIYQQPRVQKFKPDAPQLQNPGIEHSYRF